jgi:hypothetical protein
MAVSVGEGALVGVQVGQVEHDHASSELLPDAVGESEALVEVCQRGLAAALPAVGHRELEQCLRLAVAVAELGQYGAGPLQVVQRGIELT